MKSTDLNRQIDLWIAQNRDQLVEDTKKLVRIRSVADPDVSNDPLCPFGIGCAQVADAATELIEGYGFVAKNHDYYGVSAILPGEKTESIGIFTHLDVVPEGEGWTECDPYDPIEKNGFIIGRGASDDKGPAVASLYALRFLKENNIPFRHTMFAFMGCNEETGMRDVEHFLKTEPAPLFSLVADTRFSVCNGEKGILTADYVADMPAGNLLEFEGGTASNMVPNRACALLQGVSLSAAENRFPTEIDLVQEGENLRVIAYGVCGHTAFPEGTVNAIQKLAQALLDSKLVSNESLPILSFAADCFADYYGEGLNIAFTDPISGKTTHVGSTAVTANGKLTIGINVRYAVSTPREQLHANLKGKGKEYGFTFGNMDDRPPFYIPDTDPVVSVLTKIANEVLVTDLPPHVMGGGTHARKLPRAVGFGPGRYDIPHPFPTGTGKGHQINEAVSIENLLNGVKIYILALLELDHML